MYDEFFFLYVLFIYYLINLFIYYISLTPGHGILFQTTVNAVNFAGLIFRVWQHKNIFAGC